MSSEECNALTGNGPNETYDGADVFDDVDDFNDGYDAHAPSANGRGHEEDPSGIPLVEEEQPIIPIVEEEEQDLPVVEEEQPSIPIVEEEEPDIPVMEAERPIFPIIEEQQPNTPQSKKLEQLMSERNQAIEKIGSLLNKETTKLEEMMHERNQAIDNFRDLLTNELEQDNIIIAEFSERVVELEMDISSKIEELELLEKENDACRLCLKERNKVNDDLSKSLDSIKKSYAEEFKNLTSTIDELVTSNTNLETHAEELTKINEVLKSSLEESKKKNEEFEAMVSSLTDSLKESKILHEKDAQQNEQLKKENEKLKKENEKAEEEHKVQVGVWKKRIDDESNSKIHLNKEIDMLRKTLCEEQQINTKLSALEANLEATEKSMSQVTKEKNRLADELSKAQKANKDLETKLKNDPTTPLKKELNTLREVLCKEQQNNAEFVGLKARLEQTERHLAKVNEEKNKIRAELVDCQMLKEQLSSEISQSESKAEREAWMLEKKKLQKRLRESEKALVLIAKEKEELSIMFKDSKKKETSFKPLREKQPTSCNPEKEKLASDLAKLQLTYYKEKKDMMKKQSELEGLLIEALKDRFSGSNKEVMSKLTTAQSSFNRQKK